MDNFPAMIVAVASGKIDGYVSEKPGAISAVAANKDLTYVEFAAARVSPMPMKMSPSR